MNYATPQDMIDDFGLREMLCIGDPENTGAVDLVHVSHALETASGAIDFAASQHNQLPLQNLPQPTIIKLREVCCALARYKLTGSSGVTVTDVVKDRYAEVNLWLEKIALGKVFLVPQPGADAGSGGGMSAQNLTAGEASFNEGADRIFALGAFRDYFQ
jgi:phage gp36-like protein